MRPFAVVAVLLLAAAARATDEREAALAALIQRSLPGAYDTAHGETPSYGRELLDRVLASDAFVRASVGPLDVSVYVSDGVRSRADADRTLHKALAGMQPLAELLARRFDRPHGLLSGHHFPVVLCAGTPGGAFDELLALLDRCDDSGWTRDNGSLFTADWRAAPLAATWDVLLVNVAHKDAVKQKDDFWSHGLGYDVLAHLVHRLLRLGSWGAVPPWVDQGLVDELDIEAWGSAWVGGDWYESHTDGWYRPGWSGFVPEGQTPPAPVTGPPSDLATRVRATGDSWARRTNSPLRHWEQLRNDLDAAWPPSLLFMNEHQSFLPRDRAYARCLWNLMLEVAPPVGPDLLTALDREPIKLPGGLFDCAPLTSLLADWMGGVPAVDELRKMHLGEKLEVLRRGELARELQSLGAGDLLSIADYRDQGEWLVTRPDIDQPTRRRIFDLILAAEFYEQEAAMPALCERLDRAAHAALRASKAYPSAAHDREAVATAFRKALDA